MITEKDYNEIHENLDLELYEILEEDVNGFNILIVLEGNMVVTTIQNETHQATHKTEVTNFKEKDVSVLKTYFNHLWYFNSQEKEF